MMTPAFSMMTLKVHGENSAQPCVEIANEYYLSEDGFMTAFYLLGEVEY